MRTGSWVKPVAGDNGPPGGAACGAIFSVALLFEGFAGLVLFGDSEHRGALSFASHLGECRGLPPLDFHGNKLFRVDAGGRAWSKAHS